MGLAFIAYLVLTISKIGTFFGIIAAIVCVIIVMAPVWYSIASDCNSDYNRENVWVWGKRLTIIGLVSAFMCAIIPSKEDSYIIAGAYFTQSLGESVIESPEAYELRNLVMSKLRDTLKVDESSKE